MSILFQVLAFTASDRYIQNRKEGNDITSLDEAKVTAAKKSFTEQGCLGVYHGLRLEDGTTGYLFTVWKSLDQLRASTSAITAFVDILGSVPPLSQQSFTITGEHPLSALHAPVTELVVLTPHKRQDGLTAQEDNGLTPHEVEDGLTLHKAEDGLTPHKAKALKEKDGLTPLEEAGAQALAGMRTVASELAKVGAESFWGPCVEEPQVCGMICGWESMEAHQATVGQPPFSTLIGSIAAIADIGYGHAKLEKIA
ncbi:uncharacterized protein SCHCODRAFT_02616024 [Schizophyllum commune H4-8]|uniref:Expressed protein n=1 Tax=Schizophyllum commune (strain H4-8 / FGSC 9210) TaxID=578458 RepID=D8PXC2_SCHCM|nr:uncharacterized protein SCHCODRAFT_02616024 [Schizophyllum commune H4-8]KAI5896856.1 hypothetical protein SCHCODRAFT_02616024 [Schizophyllum commune H4-8]